MKIKAKEITLFPTAKLSVYPKNANVHTEEQIDKIVELINFYGHRDPLIVDEDKQEDGTHWVLAGNGRLLAAKREEWENLPIIFQKFKSEEEKYGFMVSHNAISASNYGGGLDLSKINIDIIDLGPELQIDMLGLKNFTVEPMDSFDLDKEYEDLGQIEDIDNGVKKGILIEFELEHHQEALELVNYFRKKGDYVGLMLVSLLRKTKEEYEKN